MFMLTFLHQIFLKTILYFQIIVKSIIDPDEDFCRNSEALIGQGPTQTSSQNSRGSTHMNYFV